MEPQDANEGRSSRRGFLRRLGTFAAVGLGIALMPATARAQSGRCCKNASACPCPPGKFSYQCSGCGLGPCCKCLDTDRGECFDTACPCTE